MSEVAWWLKSGTGQQETPAHATSLFLLYNIKLKNKIKTPQFIMFINSEKNLFAINALIETWEYAYK